MASDKKMSVNEMYHFVRKIKTKMTAEELITKHENCSNLLDFVKEISSYEFSSAPNYNKLRQLLLKNI
jgi:hypothetical protein